MKSVFVVIEVDLDANPYNNYERRTIYGVYKNEETAFNIVKNHRDLSTALMYSEYDIEDV